MQNTARSERKIFSVSDLNRLARQLVEEAFAQVWVEGEISNLSRPASGHWYFSLKDSGAQVRCAMFANRNRTLTFTPKDGMQVIARAKASIYEGRGEFQLIVENLMPAGEGLLQQQFEALKQKLLAEGLFAQEHKKALPTLPRHIGLITSPTGAAIRDVLSVLARRFPAVPVTLIPTQVQGAEAADQIVAALTLAQQKIINKPEFDLLILTRGGGSLEDLWSFNEEKVARAVFACRIPIVAAVGHEVDFTIAEFIADMRAPTPSAAAELVVPDQTDWQGWLLNQEKRLAGALNRLLNTQKQRFEALRKRLRHPGHQLQNYAQRLDHIESRFKHAINNMISVRQQRLSHALGDLKHHQPLQTLGRLQDRNQQLEHRLRTACVQQLQSLRQKLAAQEQALHTLSPKGALQRGYALVLDEQQQLVRSVNQLTSGSRITTQFVDGQVESDVTRVGKNDVS